MSEWITDRRPTEEDGRILISDNGVVMLSGWNNAGNCPWMPAPEPCLPRKRIRRRTARYDQLARAIPFLEILPDDPDIDELIEAAKNLFACGLCQVCDDGDFEFYAEYVDRLRTALEPKQ